MQNRGHEEIIKTLSESKAYFHGLKDNELNTLIQHYGSSVFSENNFRIILPLLLTEKNSRNADKVARTGLMLAWVAVAVGLVQIVLALCKH